jgi:hypothetical protein
MTYTIPQLALDLLGGLEPVDPAVVLSKAGDRPRPRHPRFPYAGEPAGPHSGWRVLIPASSAALIAVLARRMRGMPDGCQRALHPVFWWNPDEDGVESDWVIGGGGVFWCVRVPAHLQDQAVDWSEDQALAEAACWLARCEGVAKATGYPVDDRLRERWNADQPEDRRIAEDVVVVEEIERLRGLIPMTVEVLR